MLEILSAASDSYAKYPPIGAFEWRQAVVGWLSRRFDLSDALFEETMQILPVNGTREGLFMAAQIAPQKADGVVLIPNPFYQVYAAALATGADGIFAATPATGHLPDLDALDDSLMAHAGFIFYANPQGAVADAPRGATWNWRVRNFCWWLMNAIRKCDHVRRHRRFSPCRPRAMMICRLLCFIRCRNVQTCRGCDQDFVLGVAV